LKGNRRSVFVSNVFENSIELLEGSWPTPLLKLRIGKDVWGKLEFYNPFSRSVKDRTAFFLFREALKKDIKWIAEASSGNTAIALASLSAIFGVKFTAFIPLTSPSSFKSVLSLLGAEYVEAGDRTTDLVPLVKEFAKRFGASNLDQFSNPVNVEAHYQTTAKEIWEQMESVGKKPRRIIATVGTGGHLAGMVKFFKEVDPTVKVVGVQPAEGERIPGIKRQSSDNPFLRSYPPDELVDVRFKDALNGIRAVASVDGILIGPSAGATVAAYLMEQTDDTTVLIFPDDVFKYLDEIPLESGEG